MINALKEKNRLEVLHSLEILDSLEEEAYDELTYLASEICKVPISLISLVDKDRQWFKSKVGIAVQETPREHSFCAHVIPNNETMEIFDARLDTRFATNPLVTDEPNIVFYAGHPVYSTDGLPLGTLCVIDRKPRELNSFQKKTLQVLAGQVSKLIQIKEMTLKIQRQEKERESFLAAISHDMRNPLNLILPMADFLAQSKLSHEQMTYLQHFKVGGEYLRQLANDLVDLAKDKERAYQVVQAPFSMREMQQQLLSFFELIARKKNIKFSVQLEKGVSTAYVSDQYKIHRILWNLIMNALKFTSEGSIILKISRLEARDEHDVLSFLVSDTGAGFNLDRVDDIFKPFKQLQSGKMGSGLGLSIVKELVDSLCGSIDVAINKKGGADFSVNLFLRRTKDVVLKKTNKSLNVEKLKVLVADDDTMNRLIFRKYLEPYAQAISEAGSGDVAAQMALTADYDLVVLDIEMPTSGLEALQKIRAEKENSVVIAYTGFSLESEIDQLLEAGFDHVLVKPITMQKTRELLDVLAQIKK